MSLTHPCQLCGGYGSKCCSCGCGFGWVLAVLWPPGIPLRRRATHHHCENKLQTSGICASDSTSPRNVSLRTQTQTQHSSKQYTNRHKPLQCAAFLQSRPRPASPLACLRQLPRGLHGPALIRAAGLCAACSLANSLQKLWTHAQVKQLGDSYTSLSADVAEG